MRQLNGTITLAYLEEDNQQRVIFRVVPLCNREGAVYSERNTDFPDEGSLRIVPDKREQSTFKERMRQMGCFCAIALLADGKELTKVRQNRNYDPAQGESNRLAIYSDVINEFLPEGIFEVVEQADQPVRASRVLLMRNKVLYGPVEADQLASVNEAELKPFGNDSFLLQRIELPSGESHLLYWNPDAIISWRQRRGNLRRKGDRRLDEGAEAMDAPAEAPVEKPIEKQPIVKPIELKPVEKPVEKAPAPKPAEPTTAPKPAVKIEKAKPEPAEPKPVRRERKERKPAAPAAIAEPQAPAASPEGEQALPIGKKLDILDSNISFDEQISQLAQPLSVSANRLTDAPVEEPKEKEDEPVARVSGTPLMRMPGARPRAARRVDALQHVVDQQLQDDGASYRRVENPIENLGMALEKCWQSEECRQQAIDALLDSDSFLQPLLRTLQQRGEDPHAIAAAQAQMQDIEAERLSLLMQLDRAKEDQKKYAEEALRTLTQKKRATLDALDQQIAEHGREAAALGEKLEELGRRAQGETEQWFAENATVLCSVGPESVTVSPVVGRKRELTDMSAAMRASLREKGYECAEDAAAELVLMLGLSDQLCMLGETEADAERFARAALSALGWTDVTVTLPEGASLAVVSLLAPDSLRTPTVALCPANGSKATAFGHKTIYLARQGDALPMCPVLRVPHAAMAYADAHEPFAPAALSSFAALRAEAQPLPTEGEKWFETLQGCLTEAAMQVPDATIQDMRVFVSIAGHVLRGGFLATADAANLHWLVPHLCRHINAEAFRQALASMPRSLKAMDIQ